MSVWIEIDTEVLSMVKKEAEPFVDSPNDVLRGVLGLGVRKDRPSCSPFPSEAPLPTSSRPAQSRAEGRAPAGHLLPLEEYQLPLLQELADRGGAAPAADVIEGLRDRIWDRLSDLDKEPVRSGEPRWRNRIGFARMDAVRNGYMRADSRRGYWELTNKGRDRSCEEPG